MDEYLKTELSKHHVRGRIKIGAGNLKRILGKDYQYFLDDPEIAVGKVPNAYIIGGECTMKKIRGGSYPEYNTYIHLWVLETETGKIWRVDATGYIESAAKKIANIINSRARRSTHSRSSERSRKRYKRVIVTKGCTIRVLE